MVDEKILVEQVRDGKEVAFAALYDIYVDRIFHYLTSVLRDEDLAEDITQTCFLYIWEHRSILSSDKKFSSYLYKMARNYAYKELRSRLTAARYRDITLVTMDKFTAATDESFDLDIIRKEVEKTVESLPDSRKKIYRLLTEEHLTVNEIAERLGVSPKTVETQILRSRKKIKETLSRLSAFLVILHFFS